MKQCTPLNKKTKQIVKNAVFEDTKAKYPKINIKNG